MIDEIKDAYKREGFWEVIRESLEYLSYASRVKVHEQFVGLPDGILYNYIKWRAKIHPRYVDSNPLEPIYVDPNSITHYSNLKRPIKWGKITGGSWDRPEESFIDRDIVQGIYKYIEQNDDSLLRTAIEQRIKRGRRPVWGYEDPDCAEQRLEDVRLLIESIKTDGYLRQVEVKSKDDGWRGTYHYPPRLNEVTVNIGRDGSLYYVYCGQHRLAIAQALELEQIPVLVSHRHEKWEEKRI